MRKLIRLEIKKFKLVSYWKGIAIANLGIIAFLCLMYFGEKSESSLAFVSYGQAFTDMGSIIRATFTIFGAAILAKIIIEEYKSNSITLMFMYPIKRKQIIAAKLIIVAGFTFLTIVTSHILMGAILYAADSIYHFIPEPLTVEALIDGLINMTLGAVASAGITLIPLFFGMRKKSVVATIVSAILLVSLTNSSNGGVTAFSIIVIPVSLAIIGCVIAYLTIRNIEKVDV